MVIKSSAEESNAITIERAIAIAVIIIIASVALTSILFPEKIQNLKNALLSGAASSPLAPTRAASSIDYEKEYLQNARTIGQQHNFGQFETSLIRLGFFKGQFRADISVKNVGKETADFYNEQAFVRKDASTYAYGGGNFSGTRFLPNEERSGYILYKDVPTGISGSMTVVVGNSIGYSTIFNTQTSSPHTYVVNYS